MAEKKSESSQNQQPEPVREPAQSPSSQDTIVEVRRRIERLHDGYFIDRKIVRSAPSEKKSINNLDAG